MNAAAGNRGTVLPEGAADEHPTEARGGTLMAVKKSANSKDHSPKAKPRQSAKPRKVGTPAKSKATVHSDSQPVTSDPFDKVYMADARRMLELADNSVDLIVTSPPYFNVKDYSKDGRQEVQHSERKEGQLGDVADFDAFIAELLVIWRECARVLRPNGKLIINVPLIPMLKREFSTHESRHIFDLNAEIQQSVLRNIDGVFLLDTYIWNRLNPTKKLMFGSYPYPSNFYAQNTIEFVTVYVKEGKSKKVEQSIKDASSLSQAEWVEFTKQVWDIPIPNKSDPAFGLHSALMPEEIVRRCVRLYSFHGDVVLDPFTGSGTTLRVAKALGRRFVGYELVDSYRTIINTKLDAEVCVERTTPVLDNQFVGTSPETPSATAPPPPAELDVVVEGDCFVYLHGVEDGSVDLACVDPPYNLGKGTWDTWKVRSDFLAFTERWIDALLPKLRPGAGLFVFNTPQNCAHILTYLEKRGCEFQNWITWDKRDGFTATKRRFVPGQEAIVYVTTPGARHIFNADAVRVPYESTERIAAAASTGILKNGKRWYPNASGRLCPDVWHITSERHKTKVSGRVQKSTHPTPKPLDLIERIVLAASNPGDTVLDCFAGTGTTAVAAVRHGRHFLACEFNPEYAKVASKRVAEEQANRPSVPVDRLTQEVAQ